MMKYNNYYFNTLHLPNKKLSIFDRIRLLFLTEKRLLRLVQKEYPHDEILCVWDFRLLEGGFFEVWVMYDRVIKNGYTSVTSRIYPYPLLNYAINYTE